MKAWLIFGAVSGLALGGWLSQVAKGLDLIDGLGLGLIDGDDGVRLARQRHLVHQAHGRRRGARPGLAEQQVPLRHDRLGIVNDAQPGGRVRVLLKPGAHRLHVVGPADDKAVLARGTGLQER